MSEMEFEQVPRITEELWSQRADEATAKRQTSLC